MNYELNRLGSQEFEKMIQSLVKGIEPSVKIYGSGPDGQRDFACGNANFEIAEGKKIFGYTVGQVKFKDPNGKENDWAWLHQNLESELDGLKKGKRRKQIPGAYRTPGFFSLTLYSQRKRKTVCETRRSLL